MSNLICIVLVLALLSFNYKIGSPPSNDSEIKYSDSIQFQDSLLGIDTLEVNDSWRCNNYSERRTKKGVEWQKVLFYQDHKIEYSAKSFNSDGRVTNKAIKVNDKTFDIDKELSHVFGKELAKRYDFLEWPITAKRYPNSMQIDFVLYYKDCCCDFCNDVEIVSLVVSNSGEARIWMHGENIEEY